MAKKTLLELFGEDDPAPGGPPGAAAPEPQPEPIRPKTKPKATAPKPKAPPENSGNRLTAIPLEAIAPFHQHPFQVKEDSALLELSQSIRDNGVLTPILVRPGPSGSGYELIAGHRRKRASELAGRDTIPALIHQMDDDAAIIAMVDSNQHREDTLPSEKAFAYKMRLEAVKRRKNQKNTEWRQFVAVGRSADILSEEAGESSRQIQRYIRLTYLIPSLLQHVDEGALAVTCGVELSYLKEPEQQAVDTFYFAQENGPLNIATAQRIRKASLSQIITLEWLEKTAGRRPRAKKPDKMFTIPLEPMRAYIPPGLNKKQLENFIIRALEFYQKSDGTPLPGPENNDTMKRTEGSF